ncbi:MAG: hypothetical protein ACJ70T_04165, partial [Nitrososphaera sp.]
MIDYALLIAKICTGVLRFNYYAKLGRSYPSSIRSFSCLSKLQVILLFLDVPLDVLFVYALP